MKKTQIDVMLLLEGTYPYVSGGVSSWVHQIISGFSDLRFHCCFIGSREEDYGGALYKVPSNVVGISRHYLFSKSATPPAKWISGDAAMFDLSRQLHDQLRAQNSKDSSARALRRHILLKVLGDMEGKMSYQDFLYSFVSWQYISEQYMERCSDPSFVDYFWTVRTMHSPLWSLVELAKELPPARVYHTISTGYAGYLGTVLSILTQKPLILSEHGVYTKERRIDLFAAQWISENLPTLERQSGDTGYIRQLWIGLFEALGRMCYDSADPVIALYEANRLRQIKDGADPSTTCLIPNGVNIKQYLPARAKRHADIPPVMCLIGRVVPIKDVKTFIRAVRIASSRFPRLEGWIAGPEEEDPDYVKECKQLAASLDLGEKIKFLGFQKLTELLPQVGVVVLSSISEALPLVLLEGFAAGVPAVTTDVGSCRQLIYGLNEEDRALGEAGEVVGIADPQALGEACLSLLSNETRYRRAQAAAIARVERFYTLEQMFDKYRQVYADAFERSAKGNVDEARRGRVATLLRDQAAQVNHSAAVHEREAGG